LTEKGTFLAFGKGGLGTLKGCPSGGKGFSKMGPETKESLSVFSMTKEGGRTGKKQKMKEHSPRQNKPGFSSNPETPRKGALEWRFRECKGAKKNWKKA